MANRAAKGKREKGKRENRKEKEGPVRFITTVYSMTAKAGKRKGKKERGGG